MYFSYLKLQIIASLKAIFLGKFIFIVNHYALVKYIQNCNYNILYSMCRLALFSVFANDYVDFTCLFCIWLYCITYI